MFKQEVEAVAMVMMAQMAELVKQDIVLKDSWESDYVKIQIYVSLG